MPKGVLRPVKFYPRGGMSLDLDPLGMQEGNYGDALNVHHLTRSGKTTDSVEITKGNSFAFNIPDCNVSTKTFRVYADVSAGAAYTYAFDYYDGNGKTIVSGTPYTLSGSEMTVILDALGAIRNVIVTDMGATNINNNTSPVLTTTGANTGYLEFSITTIPFWNYSIRESVTLSGNPTTLPTFVVISEAIDFGMNGIMKVIGSHDLLGDAFIWSTTQSDLPVEYDILGVADNGIGRVRIEIADTSVFGNNNVGCIISGVQDTTLSSAANGQWIVEIQDATHFDLWGSSFAGTWTSGTGKVTVNPYSVGEIGVAQKDDNNNTWSYTTLLRTREWNFRVIRQPKTYCERSGRLAYIYWTDNYSIPRVFYYEGNYLNNGGLHYVNPLGQYEYGSIGDETRLIRNESFFDFRFINQVQSGGGGTVYSGNHRYVIRFLTENLTPTLWSDLSNDINVCVADVSPTANNATAQKVGGDASYTHTGKINQFLISGIVPNLFKYVELGDVYYADGVPVGTIIRRDLLSQASTQTIEHRGDETNTQLLDLSILSAIQSDIITALNIDAVDNRLVLSNTTSSTALDFSEWTKTWKHTPNRKEIDGVGVPQLGTYSVNEYMLPTNVYNNVGYMFNEIYRFGAKFRLKNGQITETFWIDDIRFDLLTTNLVANPTDDRRNGNNIPTYDLTDATAAKVYVPYINFNGIDLTFQIGGVQAKDLITEIIFERVEMDEAKIEVLGSGVNVMSALFNFSVNPLNTSSYYDHLLDINFNFGNPPSGTGSMLSDFPFASGGWLYDTINVLPNNSLYTYNTFSYQPAWTIAPFYSVNRQFFSFYCPDVLYGNQDFEYQSGDSILNFGSPVHITIASDSAVQIGNQGGITGYAMYSSIREYSGHTGASITVGTPLGYESPTVTSGVRGINLLDSKNINKGGIATVNSQGYSKKFLVGMGYDPGIPPPVSYLFKVYEFYIPQSKVGATDQDLTTNGSIYTDYGVYMGQYYRFKGSAKFGEIANSKYVPCGVKVNIDNTTLTPVDTDVFGGDVFTQKTYLKHMNSETTDATVGSYLYGWTGFSSGFGYYSQNRVNTQQKNTGNGLQFTEYDYPHTVNTTWLEAVEGQHNPVYNKGYNIINGVTTDNGFDQNSIRVTHQPARMWWSDLKPENSIVDNYTSFLPINFRDEDLSYGHIEDHKNINGNLQVWQQRAFIQEYFNSSGILVTSAEEAVLGNAGVMTRKGSTFSTYGTKHGFSVIKGKTASGKDCTYWIDTETGKVMRHEESDGTVCLSDQHNMRSFFNNNLRFADLYNTPAHGEGIHGTWDDQNSEAIWTVRAHKEVPVWIPNSYVYKDLYDLDSTPDGASPSGMISVGGKFFGVTYNGGANGVGTLFEYDPITNTYTNLHDFSSANGANPVGIMVASDGIIYGLTQNGGANSVGILFSYNIWTTTFTNVIDLDLTTTGGNPNCCLVEDGTTQLLYFITSTGGVNGLGSFVEYNIGVSTTIYYDFVSSDGYDARGKLILSGGNIYASMYNGGANGLGSLVKMSVAVPFTKLHDFGGLLDGKNPNSGVMFAPDGNIYGGTEAGGLNGDGVLFQYNPTTSAYTKKHDFLAINGRSVSSTLFEYNNALYGTTEGGGVHNKGTFFYYDFVNDVFRKRYDFDTATGEFPAGSLLIGNFFYGTTQTGGANSSGVIYSLELTTGVYDRGGEVVYGNSNFEQTPDIYISLVDGNNNNQPDTSPLFWDKKSHKDPDYYNEYTIAFNEETNKFTTFYTFKPKIFLKRGKSFLSPRPVLNESNIYEHLSSASDYATWYHQQGASPVEQSEDGYVDGMIINWETDLDKHFVAMLMQTEIVPERVEFETKKYKSFMTSSDFTGRGDQWVGAIKNDSTITSTNPSGANDQDTSFLFGSYLSVKLIFKAKVYQKLFNFVSKIKMMSRFYNS